jgi:Fe-S cluster assembly protein SufD
MIVTETTSYQDQFERLEQELASEKPQWLVDLQRRGLDRFNELGFPSTKLEDWRFTNVAALAKQAFVAPLKQEVTPDARELAAQAMLDQSFHRLVFLNGRFAPELSQRAKLPAGVSIEPLSSDLKTDSSFVAGHLGRNANLNQSTFTALNTALFQDGATIRIADEVALDTPIHLVFITGMDSQAAASFPRNVIDIGKSASAKIVETHVGTPGAAYFTNCVTEIALGEGAALDHYKLQSDSIAAHHIAATHVDQQASSSYRNHYFAFGAALSRNEIYCMLGGEKVEAVLNGLYMVSGGQLADCRTRIDHAKPHCESHEMYKGILDNKARGVFNGKIHVHPDAQKTDAKQSNQALLLSDDAVIDTKPELEIYADDVRCTHGATVGELDSKALFYLRSRGIPEPLARKMLIFAFANDVVQGLRIESLKKYLESVLLADHGLPQV